MTEFLTLLALIVHAGTLTGLLLALVARLAVVTDRLDPVGLDARTDRKVTAPGMAP